MGANIPNNNYNYLFKIVMLGDSAVGKSNIRTRLIFDEFNDEFKPTIDTAEVGSRNIQIDENIVKAQLYDIGCQKRVSYRDTIRLYCRGAMGALLVYDITSPTTFKNVEQWLKNLRSYPENNNLVIMLVGNKSDLDQRREVSVEEAKSFAERENLLFIETSALNATNIEEAFKKVVTQIYNNVKNT